MKTIKVDFYIDLHGPGEEMGPFPFQINPEGGVSRDDIKQEIADTLAVEVEDIFDLYTKFLPNDVENLQVGSYLYNLCVGGDDERKD